MFYLIKPLLDRELAKAELSHENAMLHCDGKPMDTPIETLGGKTRAERLAELAQAVEEIKNAIIWTRHVSGFIATHK